MGLSNDRKPRIQPLLMRTVCDLSAQRIMHPSPDPGTKQCTYFNRSSAQIRDHMLFRHLQATKIQNY